MSLQTPSSAHPPLLRKPICRWNEWLKDELSWGHQPQQTVTSEHNNPSVSDPPCNRRPCARCWPGLGQVRRLTWACSIFSTAFRLAASPTIHARELRRRAKACRPWPKRCSPYLRSTPRRTSPAPTPPLPSPPPHSPVTPP